MPINFEKLQHDKFNFEVIFNSIEVKEKYCD